VIPVVVGSSPISHPKRLSFQGEAVPNINRNGFCLFGFHFVAPAVYALKHSKRRSNPSFTKNPQKNESSAHSGVTKPTRPRYPFQLTCAVDPEKPMKSRAIKTLPGTVVVLTFVTAVLGIGLETSSQAQTAGSADSASMAKPPVTPSAPNANGARTYNPDNMPTKRPALPPNSNRMLRNNPVSDAIAK
jgi:hypothetical protein